MGGPAGAVWRDLAFRVQGSVFRVWVGAIRGWVHEIQTDEISTARLVGHYMSTCCPRVVALPLSQQL